MDWSEDKQLFSDRDASSGDDNNDDCDNHEIDTVFGTSIFLLQQHNSNPDEDAMK